VARNLVIFGLALIAAALLVHVVAAILAVAVPAGALLVVVGVIWYLVERARRNGQEQEPDR
jgi:Flp pilus assembly protein TadB